MKRKHEVGDWVTLNPNSWSHKNHTTIYFVRHKKNFGIPDYPNWGYNLGLVFGEEDKKITREDDWWLGNSLLPAAKISLPKLEEYE